jgi:glycine/D-amino acid oxidase-like deaminating enzyme
MSHDAADNSGTNTRMSRLSSLLASDFREEPYWWNVARPEILPEVVLDRTYDVAIVGAGLTGLRAAIDLARAGMKVVVFDAEDVGFGASRRNAGYLGRSLKKSYSVLRRNHGITFARRVYEELNSALKTTLEFISAERIECHANRVGRFIAATSSAHLTRLVADHRAMNEELGFDYRVVATEGVREEMGTSIYFGGIVVPDHASLHPGLYHQGLLKIALAAGVTVSARTNVLSLQRGGPVRFRVTTSAGVIDASTVVITTNGYTPRELRWWARRLIPFTGYMAATEELPPDLLRELIPNGRTAIDSNVNTDFFRFAPDEPRLLFGGAAGVQLRDTDAIAHRMHSILIRVYPQLRNVRLSAVWSGKCAATFDMMPHMGSDDGLWYGMGYNFAGVPMGSYFGMKIAHGILGRADVASIFTEMPFKTMPFYDGTPWFVPMAMRMFDWQDRWIARRR